MNFIKTFCLSLFINLTYPIFLSVTRGWTEYKNHQLYFNKYLEIIRSILGTLQSLFLYPEIICFNSARPLFQPKTFSISMGVKTKLLVTFKSIFRSIHAHIFFVGTTYSYLCKRKKWTTDGYLFHTTGVYSILCMKPDVKIVSTPFGLPYLPDRTRNLWITCNSSR